LRIQPASVVAGAAPPPLGTVTLTAPAPQGGATIALASDAPASASTAPTLEIPEGAQAGFFHLTVAAVNEPTDVVITAQYAGATRTASLKVLQGTGTQAAPPEHDLAVPASASSSAMSRGDGAVPPQVRDDAATATVIHTTTVAEFREVQDPQQSFRAALIALTPALPILACIATIMLYVTPAPANGLGVLAWLKVNPLISGTTIGFVITMGLAWLYFAVFHGTSADQANASNYSQLCQRLEDVRARLEVIAQRPSLSEAEQGALRRAAACAELVRAELTRAGPRWILGTGYVNLWSLVHRAEEDLLLVESLVDVVAAALYDELRLEGAQMDNSPDLLNKLRTAIVRLQPSAAIFLDKQAASGTGTATAVAQAPADGIDAAGARAALRDVRQVVNDFRDSSWGALVRTRNHLMGTLTVTGVATYLLLAMAVSGSANNGLGSAPVDLLADPIAVAATLYLVGAVVGLFNRMYSESGSDNAIEDYGLTVARLSLTPMLAGLAALGGVLIVAVAPQAFNASVFSPVPAQVAPAQTGQPTVTPTPASTPGAAAASPAAPQQRSTVRLEDIYNLHTNPIALIVAAVFGLTPSLLIGALQNASDRYRDGLKSTAAPGATRT
jgi:hypothetical protein